MYLDGQRNRRRAFVLLSLFLLVTCLVAEDGILVLIVTDTGQHPFANVRISTAGDAGSPQSTDQGGKARLKLAPNTKPAAWATLLLLGGPQDVDLVFVSPYDGRVRVPPFDNEQENYDPVVLAKRGDKNMLESGSGMLAIHSTANHSAAAAQHKKPPPKSDLHPLFDGPRWIPVVLHLGPANNKDENETDDAGLLAAAERFGLSVADIKAAITSWGGSPLAWKAIQMTASIGAGGTDPFPFVHASANDITFGAESWSLRGCSLQPVLRKFEERDHQLFASIFGNDAEWLNEALKAPCETSSSIIRERALEGPGVLRRSWRDQFRKLGNQPAFQHVQVQELTRLLEQARSQASTLGMASDQAAAFCAYVDTQAGAAMISSQQQNVAQDVVAFRQQAGREPDEQERLLLLGNRVAAALRSAAPPFPPPFLAQAALLSSGKGSVLGQYYDLGDFGMGLNDSQNGAGMPPRHEQEAPAKLAAGGTSSQPGSSPALTAAPPPPAQSAMRPLGSNNPPAGTQFDPPAERQFVDLINQERARQGVPPVQLDPRLTEAARQHSIQMAQHHAVSHQVPGEPPLGTRFADRDLRTSFNGEAVASGTSVPTVHRGLMGHPEHRDIILNPSFNAVGVGVLNYGGLLYVTEDFAQLQQNYSNDDAAGAVQNAIAGYAAGHGLPTPMSRPQPELQQVACNLAQTHALDAHALQALPGFRNAVAWATPNLHELPGNATAALSQPLSGYSLGVCFAPSARVYWVVMVTY